MKVINYTELRQNLKKYLDLVDEGERVFITRDKNRKPCVLISLDEYDRLTNPAKNGNKEV